MSIALSFPGLVMFLLAGAAEIIWISPSMTDENPREAKIAGSLGITLLILGVGLYAAGLLTR